MTPSDDTPHEPAADAPADGHEPLAMERPKDGRPFWQGWHLPVGPSPRSPWRQALAAGL